MDSVRPCPKQEWTFCDGDCGKCDIKLDNKTHREVKKRKKNDKDWWKGGRYA